ncbi:hypothetical protein DFH09DRAFT_1294928 [Mycena vulgaris]|nr:hypothetical protein DFH09DRAFT_1294928 [Mycena vulgaris]
MSELSKGNPDADVKDMGVGAVPSIAKTQQLKDGGLVVTVDSETEDGALEYYESWSAERIDKKFAKLLPHVWSYMQRVHQPLEDGDYYWVPLVSHRSTLFEFVKKGSITGSDLETIKSGKGKRTDLSTLYFALRNNVPDKIWHNDAWDDPPSDSDFEEPSARATKGRGKVRSKPPSTRRSSRKFAKGNDEHTAIEFEVESDGDNVPPDVELKRKGKTSQRSTPVKIKLEPELAAIAKSDSLFFDVDSDSDVDFPDALISAPHPDTSAAFHTTIPVVVGAAASAPSTAAGPVPAAVLAALPSPGTSAPPPATLPPVPSVIVAAVTVVPSAPSASGTATVFHPELPRGHDHSSFGHPHKLGPLSSASSHSGHGPFGLYRSSHTSGSSSSSAASSSSHPSPFHRGIDYAAETAAMESFNKYGNYLEAPPKRTFDVAFLETGFKSPERPAYNPWKRRKPSA